MKSPRSHHFFTQSFCATIHFLSSGFLLSARKKAKCRNLKNMQEITFNTLPEAVKTILEQVQVLNQKIDNLPTAPQEADDNRFVDINEIRQTVFPQWKRQTIYNKCCLGEIPHSRIGSRLLFNLKECREWRDKQLQHGKIKSNAEIQTEAEEFVTSRKGGLK
jgi:hypothetical protein